MRLPVLKRHRGNLSPIGANEELKEVPEEMKTRMNDSEALVDYVKGLFSNSPKAKQQSTGVSNDETFHTQSGSGDLFIQRIPIKDDE